MRKKSENEARDRYARRSAAVLAVEAMIQFRARGIRTLITVEAEDNALWDDIAEKNDALNINRRHQVKRQMTDLTTADFAEYVKEAAKGGGGTDYHFAFTALVKVKKAGETRVLRASAVHNSSQVPLLGLCAWRRR